MDEVQKIILDVQGRDKVEQLNAALKAEQEALAKLAADLRTGAIAQGQFDQAAQAAAGKVVQLNEQLQALSGRGMSSGGILQASYAVQDFTSVLSGGQGLDRALSSVQNNIPGLLMALGASGGLAGVVSLVSVGIGALLPFLGRLWESLESDSPEKAKERLKSLQDEIKRTREAFERLAENPDTPERESAAAVTDFLGQRPHAEMAKKAVIESMGRKSTEEALKAAGTRDEWGLLGPAAEMSDESIERAAAREAANAEDPATAEAAANRMRANLQGQRDTARQQRFNLERPAKAAYAEKMVTDAQAPGPAGAKALRALIDRTKDVPGLRDLQYFTPENLAQDQADWEETQAQNQAIAESGQEAGRNIRARQKAEKQQAAEAKRRRANAQREYHETTAEGVSELEQTDAMRAQDERDAARAREQAARAREQAAREAPRNRARQMVIGMAQDEGVGTPTAEQANQMADMALQNMSNGMDAQAASWMAVQSKIAQINQATQRYAQAMAQQRDWSQRMNGGGSDQGQFSAMFPAP